MFRNLTFFRFPQGAISSPLDLRDSLEKRPLRDIGPMEQATFGFVSPYGREAPQPVVVSNGNVLFCLGGWEKILPAAVVREALATKIAEVQRLQMRRVGAKQRQRLKEEVLADLLPRAFVRHTRTLAYMDVANGWLVIDTASLRKAEQMVSEVREALGRFPAIPVHPSEHPRALMTDWLVRNNPPDDFALGSECLLRDPSESSSTWTGRNTDLGSDEVRNHLAAGMQVHRLGVVFRDRLELVLGEDLIVRKLRYTDIVEEQRGLIDAAETQELVDAEFAILHGEIAGLLGTMTPLFGIARPE